MTDDLPPIIDILRCLSHEKLTPSQLLTLYTARDGKTMSDLARTLKVSSAAVTGSVDRLVSLGLVERSHNDDDRRKITLRITDAGRTEIAAFEQRFCIFP